MPASAVKTRRIIDSLIEEKLKAIRAPYGFSRSLPAYNGPDPFRVRDQLSQLQSMWNTMGSKEFMFRMCWIQPKPPEKGERQILPTPTKRWNKPIVPFLLNRIQSDCEDHLGNRNIFLKPRQAGYTTYMIIRRLFIPCILNPGHNGLLMGQNSAKVTSYFRILKRCYKWFGAVDPFDRVGNQFCEELKQHLLHTSYSNRKELIFDQIDTVISCESAEISEAGQGFTYTHVACTEVARWPGNPEETLANMKAAIPAGGTFDMESTANGWGGYFFEEAMRARDKQNPYREFTYHFHTWWMHDEYKDDIPVSEESLTKEEQKLIFDHNLTLKQISWRRRKKAEFRNDFDEKYTEDDITCFLLSGQQYFDKDILRERRMELNNYTPLRQANKITVHKKAKAHHQYIIGADVASGLDATEGANDLDWSAAVVVDRETGEMVATYRAHIIPEWYAEDLVELGKLYNDALIAVERNEDGGAVILHLQVGCMYTNVYKHRDWWKRDWRKRQRPGQIGQVDQQRIREIEGWPTNNKTRPIALNRFRNFIQESPHLVHDVKVIEECLTFVRDQDKKGRPGAAPGCHDDYVMAAGIAYAVRAILLGYLVPEAIKRERYGDTPQELAEETGSSED